LGQSQKGNDDGQEVKEMAAGKNKRGSKWGGNKAKSWPEN